MNNQDIDKLVYESVFGDENERADARLKIWNLALENDVIPASINDLYMARGRNELPHNFAVPAMNLRGMAYDMARAVFSTAKKHKVGALICELARSEMGYTDQPPAEYATVVMAAAVREGWRGPLFIQCDHFQAKQEGPGKPKEGEIETVKQLIKDSVRAGMLNVDIDMSTLVDLEKSTEKEQQVNNVKYSVEIAKFVRSIEPKGVTISLGGEIGHIGGVNSTLADCEAYMDGFNADLPKGMIGMSKISPQSGTHHGGVVLADGSLADVSVDFSILSKMSKLCRDKYKMGGTVQHGASTLPDEYFNQFVKSEALEVHLATGFQNIQMDHEVFPKELLNKMYTWLDEEKIDEKKPDQTDEQFHYKLRKKAWGQFKKECWDIDEESRSKIRESLAKRFEFMFKELNVLDTKDMVEKVVKPVKMTKSKEDFEAGNKTGEVKGLAD